MISSNYQGNRTSVISKYDVEEAVMDVCNHLRTKSQKLSITWHEYSEDDLWVEMVACILGSRVSYELAQSCITHLVESEQLDLTKIMDNPSKSEHDISKELSKPIYINGFSGQFTRYPFSVSRAHYIVETATAIYSTITIKQILNECSTEHEARDLITKRCLGIGYKQASLFLRNIGFSANLAILDVHVLRYMTLMNLVEINNAHVVSRKQEYARIERILNEYAFSKDMPVPSLDLAIWVVMRLARREWCICQ